MTVEESTGLVRSVFDTSCEPDGMLLKACRNRRTTVCPTCAETYRADSYQLVSAGLQGGKSVPASVASHPRLFVTLTAPSFGPVHSAGKPTPVRSGCAARLVVTARTGTATAATAATPRVTSCWVSRSVWTASTIAVRCCGRRRPASCGAARRSPWSVRSPGRSAVRSVGFTNGAEVVPIVRAGDWRFAGRGYRTPGDAWLAETAGIARAHQRREARAAIRAPTDLPDRRSA